MLTSTLMLTSEPDVVACFHAIEHKQKKSVGYD